jgi:hypothetical protein
MISKDLICQELKSKGYIEVIKTNGEPYSGKDMYFCPQAPDLYLLKIVRGFARIEKTGKSNYSAELSTKVNSIEDIEKLHQEINNIILNQDESTLKNKTTGCFASVAILFGLSYFTYYILNL